MTGSETVSLVASVSWRSSRKLFAEMYCVTELPFSGVKTTTDENLCGAEGI